MSDPKSKSAASVIIAVGQILGTAASLLDLIGDVVNAKKVRAILNDADFPTFARRAEAAGEAARSALDDTDDESALDDRLRPSNE